MTAPALALLHELTALGVAAEARGGALVLRPAAAVEPDLRDRLRAAKPALLALLAGETLAADPGRVGTAEPQEPAQGPQDGRCLDLVFVWAPERPGSGGAAWSPEELAEARLEWAAIRAEGRAPGEPLAASARLPEGADPDRPPAGWLYVRSGRLAGCWVGPSGEVETPAARPGGAP